MPRIKTGTVITRGKGVYARLRYVDKFGKTRSVEEKADNRSDARNRLKRMLRKLEDQGPAALASDRTSFAQLADLYKNQRLIAAKYSVDAQGRPTTKQRGLRSLQSPLLWQETLRKHFGRVLLKNLTYADIETFRNTRLDAPTIAGTPRAIASVNRELELLRAMLNFAVQNEMVSVSPFKRGPSLISKSDENKRDRTLGHDEEIRLLKACEETLHREYERKGKKVNGVFKTRRRLLKSLVIVALDTALRKNELLTLRWSDVDRDARVINILAYNSKTARPRSVGMTPRVWGELDRLYGTSQKNNQGLVFGI
jgi:integrase